MTNDLEKQFFDTFGIEPHYYCADEYIFEAMLENECTEGNREKCKTCKKVSKSYPQITDRILLELVVLHSSWCMPRLCCFDLEQLKEQVLSDLTLFNDEKIELIHQVRTLFEEG